MVRTVCHCTLFAALVLLPSAVVFARALPELNPGDISTEEILTPVPLVVIDEEATAALREKEAARVPTIFRFNPAAVDEAEAAYLAVMQQRHDEFTASRRAAFGDRKLEPADLESPRFRKLVESFRRGQQQFPLTTNLAGLWAQDDPASGLRDEYAARLHEAMLNHIRPIAVLPPDLKLTPSLLVVPMTHADEDLTLELATERGRLILRKDMMVLDRLRASFVAGFPPQDSQTARFLATFLKPNCVVEAELTRQARADHVAQLYAGDRYEAGATLVTSGQMVDSKIKAALDQLREKLRVEELQAQVSAGALAAEQISLRNRWLLAALAVVSLAGGVATWVALRRRRHARSLLPARSIAIDNGAALVSCPSCHEEIALSHALLRDVLTGSPADPRTREALRERLFPHLAKLMMDQFTRRLLTQRSGLLAEQQRAAAEVSEMERRLEQVQAPLQDRLRAYETRISDLERDLAAKDEQSRELIRMKIALTRRQIEITRSKSPVGWN